jgi:hypothetical protein
VVERQVLGRQCLAAILATEPVAKKYVKSSEGNLATSMEAFQGNDRRDRERPSPGGYL